MNDPIAIRRGELQRKLARCLGRAADRVRMGVEIEREYIHEIRFCQNELAVLTAIETEVAAKDNA
jgi:hypothetical protein